MRIVRSFAAMMVCAFTFAAACVPPASEPTSRQEEAPSVVATDEAPSEAEISEARTIVLRADFEAQQNLSDAQKARNKEIFEAIQERRLALMTVGLPPWIKEQVLAFEKEYGEGGAAFSQIIGWGAGNYKGKPFQWFSHTNSDGWLQISMSIELVQADANQILGIKPGDLEGVASQNREVDVTVIRTPDDARSIITPGTKTHIGTKDGINWTDEFCAQPGFAPCDTLGAFEKYLLPAANRALAGLSFTIQGRFP